MARAVLPLALLFILAACGGSTKTTSQPTAAVRGDGFSVEVPNGSNVTRPPNAVVAKHGGVTVSVTVFALRKGYDPEQFDAAAASLDRVVERLAKAAGTTVSSSETTTISDRKARVYRYGGRRVAFVLEGKREYQLYCSAEGAACTLLFDTFTLAGGPPS